MLRLLLLLLLLPMLLILLMLMGPPSVLGRLLMLSWVARWWPSVLLSWLWRLLSWWMHLLRRLSLRRHSVTDLIPGLMLLSRRLKGRRRGLRSGRAR